MINPIYPVRKLVKQQKIRSLLRIIMELPFILSKVLFHLIPGIPDPLNPLFKLK